MKKPATLIEYLTIMYLHGDKEKTAKFQIMFFETKRVCEICKVWNRIYKRWEYLISEPYAPTFAYSEEQIIGAIAGISQIRLFTNMVKYEVCNYSIE